MKLSAIAEELAKLDPDASDDDVDDEAVKLEIEKNFLVEHPQVTDETVLNAMREVSEAEKTDPARAKDDPVVTEGLPDEEEAWLKRVLEKRRASAATQPQPRAPAPRWQQPQQRNSWIWPHRRDSLLDGGEWHLGGWSRF